jgi:hypothetical protein
MKLGGRSSSLKYSNRSGETERKKERKKKIEKRNESNKITYKMKIIFNREG